MSSKETMSFMETLVYAYVVDIGDMISFTLLERSGMRRANSRGVSAGELLLWLTLGTCIVAVVDPRFRKACLGLLCKLG